MTTKEMASTMSNRHLLMLQSNLVLTLHLMRRFKCKEVQNWPYFLEINLKTTSRMKYLILKVDCVHEEMTTRN